tara:strand:+ start:628 stop:819 length:192 start_codon:yes stop_codon:yes gene_type:complete
MKVGDLVKLTNIVTDDYLQLRGVILDVYPDPEGEFGANLVEVLWTDGDLTSEFSVDLEVVSCK